MAERSANDCPECRQGKHATCAEWSMDDTDAIVPCPCAEREHRMVSEVITLDEPLSEKDAEVYGGAFREVHVRVYKVYTVQRDGKEWIVCPICGPIDGAVLKGHGPNHMVPDGSA